MSELKGRPIVKESGITLQDLLNQVEKLRLMSLNSSSREESTEDYHCQVCLDSTFKEVEKEGRIVYAVCECREANEIRKRWERTGYMKIFAGKTMESYITEGKHKAIHRAKRMAMHYVENFPTSGKGKKPSIVFGGTVGAGKTHLCMAIASELMNRNVGVEYLSYRESVTDLKQTVTDSINYKKAINKYLKAPVLLIDDLFKGRITDSDINIFFEIINHRYLHQRPIIVSSEFSHNQLIEIDEAIGSRIVEMCRGYIIHFGDHDLNHRLNS